ncbi:hypothetical protein L3X38_030190 [Prunus dulcis]|uniref:RNase H type-1 domain-containing protein n=1 Tax=Prunus dulcis TaxID=3755 RepID=A0AAD4V9T3_PRUDU|nr:hypothetical protein L3X38_030190 [Prunus dulcis]
MLKLNVDGSHKGSTGCIGADGVIRNSLGEWIGEFAVNLGMGQILDAELWSLFLSSCLIGDLLGAAKPRMICVV